jgi:hypothetical protein
VPTTPPPEAMTLAKAETVELKGQRLADMDDDRLDKLRAWAQDKGNQTFILAAIDAIQSARAEYDGDAERLDWSLPF